MTVGLTVLPTLAFTPLDNVNTAKNMVSRHTQADPDTDPYRNIGFAGLERISGYEYSGNSSQAQQLISTAISRMQSQFSAAESARNSYEVDAITDTESTYRDLVGTPDINNRLYLSTYKAILDNSNARQKAAINASFSLDSIKEPYEKLEDFRELVLNQSQTGLFNVLNEYQIVYDKRKDDLHKVMVQGYHANSTKYANATSAIQASARYTNCSSCGVSLTPKKMNPTVSISKVKLDKVRNTHCTSVSYTNETKYAAQSVRSNCI